jgi:S-methylmethionine-dependent homocysteine/selenocysteine methylase
MGAEYNGTRAEPSDTAARLRERLEGARARRAPPLVLDGALGTELERRGVAVELPLWSARALLADPHAVATIHRDYVAAGAEALTANTFRTARRALAREGLGARAAELTRRAVALAREAAASAARPAFVLGSQAPLEDCYRPDLVPSGDALEREHAEHAAALVAAGVDAILVETMNAAREAAAAAGAARAAGAAFLASFVCDGGGRLLSGEPLEAGLEAVLRFGPLAVGVNCLPPNALEACLPALAASGLPFFVYPNLVYPNLGAPTPDGGFAPHGHCAPAAFGALARGWIAAGAAAVGGCCGTEPAHVAALAGVCASAR